MILADWDRFNVVSLDLACDLFSIPSPKTGEVKAEDVEEYYHAGKIDAIAEYCLKDVDTTYEVYKKLTQYIKN
jgi:predicted PolB exonuclease-like 3'-5' exonuclease